MPNYNHSRPVGSGIRRSGPKPGGNGPPKPQPQPNPGSGQGC